jgi:hypothetical protein
LLPSSRRRLVARTLAADWLAGQYQPVGDNL